MSTWPTFINDPDLFREQFREEIDYRTLPWIQSRGDYYLVGDEGDFNACWELACKDWRPFILVPPGIHVVPTTWWREHPKKPVTVAAQFPETRPLIVPVNRDHLTWDQMVQVSGDSSQIQGFEDGTGVIFVGIDLRYWRWRVWGGSGVIAFHCILNDTYRDAIYTIGRRRDQAAPKSGPPAVAVINCLIDRIHNWTNPKEDGRGHNGGSGPCYTSVEFSGDVQDKVVLMRNVFLRSTGAQHCKAYYGGEIIKPYVAQNLAFASRAFSSLEGNVGGAVLESNAFVRPIHAEEMIREACFNPPRSMQGAFLQDGNTRYTAARRNFAYIGDDDRLFWTYCGNEEQLRNRAYDENIFRVSPGAFYAIISGATSGDDAMKKGRKLVGDGLPEWVGPNDVKIVNPEQLESGGWGPETHVAELLEFVDRQTGGKAGPTQKVGPAPLWVEYYGDAAGIDGPPPLPVPKIKTFYLSGSAPAIDIRPEGDGTAIDRLASDHATIEHLLEAGRPHEIHVRCGETRAIKDGIKIPAGAKVTYRGFKKNTVDRMPAYVHGDITLNPGAEVTFDETIIHTGRIFEVDVDEAPDDDPGPTLPPDFNVEEAFGELSRQMSALLEGQGQLAAIMAEMNTRPIVKVEVGQELTEVEG